MINELVRRIAELEKRLEEREADENASGLFYDDNMPLTVSVGAGSSIPSFTAYNGGNLKAYEFLGTGVTTKDLAMGFQLPHSWKTGDTVYLHLHLFVPSGTTGDIKFGFNYTWISINGVEAGETTITGTKTISSGAANNGNCILAIDSSAMAGTGQGISSIIYGRLYRDPADGADTFGASVWLKSVDLHIRHDALGSRQEYVK